MRWKGGIAGGDKYQVMGILFKFALDKELRPNLWMYGGHFPNDSLAMKAGMTAAGPHIACPLILSLSSLHVDFTLTSPLLPPRSWTRAAITSSHSCLGHHHQAVCVCTTDGAHQFSLLPSLTNLILRAIGLVVGCG